MNQAWKHKRLGELCFVKSGGTPLRSSKEYWDNGEIPWYSSGELNDLFTKESVRFITNKGLEGSNAKLFEKGSLLIGMYDTAALKMSIIDRDATFNQAIAGVAPSDSLDLIFLFHAINAMKPELLKQRRGVRQKNLSLSKIKDILIPTPPLEEQKQIVALLDKTFAAIDHAKANVEKNLQNAKELFQSKLNEIFTQKGEGWEEKTLPEIVDENCTLSYGIVQPGEEFLNGLPVIRPTDLKTKYVQMQKLKRIDPVKAEGYKRTQLTGEELLLCVRGDTGVVSLVSNELTGANVTRGIVPVRFNKSILSINFGYYLFVSPFMQSQIKDKTYGAALMQINIRDLRKLSVLIPPQFIQSQIVKKLNALSAHTSDLENTYQKHLNDLDELKKSILQKAFAGKLELK